jgi:hypothetical protein
LEAEQRWPLFKAVAPKKAPHTPVLTEEEKNHWNNPEKSLAKERQPALSLPGLSVKLAKSLNKISEQTSLEAVTTAPKKRTTPRKTPSKPIPVIESVQVATPPIMATPQLSRPPIAHPTPQAEQIQAQPMAEPTTTVVPPMKSAMPQLRPTFQPPVEPQTSQKATIKIVREMTPATNTKSTESAPTIDPDDTLVNIFNRIEGEKTIRTKTAAPRSSFLGRLGKR